MLKKTHWPVEIPMQTCSSYNMLTKTHWPVETKLYPAFGRNWREQLHAPPRPDVCVISERQEDEMSLSQLVPPKPSPGSQLFVHRR